MSILPEKSSSKVKAQELAANCKSQADRELLKILSYCKSVLWTALVPFLSGKLINHQPVSVVHIIEDGAPLYRGFETYRYALCFIHCLDVITPASADLISEIKLFCRLLRHCVKPYQYENLRKLIRLLEALFTLIEGDRERPLDTATFDSRLGDQLNKIKDHLCEKVADDIQARQDQLWEFDVRGESAPPCPNPDKEALPGGIVDFKALPTPPPPPEKRLETIAANQVALMERFDKLNPPKVDERKDVYDLYTDLYTDPMIGHNFRKVADVTRYILNTQNPDERFASRILDAKRLAKSKYPNDSGPFWRSVASVMRGKLKAKKREPQEKPKPRGAKPRPVSIPDRSWA